MRQLAWAALFTVIILQVIVAIPAPEQNPKNKGSTTPLRFEGNEVSCATSFGSALGVVLGFTGVEVSLFKLPVLALRLFPFKFGLVWKTVLKWVFIPAGGSALIFAIIITTVISIFLDDWFNRMNGGGDFWSFWDSLWDLPFDIVREAQGIAHEVTDIIQGGPNIIQGLMKELEEDWRGLVACLDYGTKSFGPPIRAE